MDYQEAIEIHVAECRHRIDVISDFMNTNKDADEDGCLKNIEILRKTISSMQELKEYKQLGTLEEVREAVEKQKAKKPIEDRDHGIRYTEVYRCPSCNGSFLGKGFVKYCFHCGKKIDWSDEE